MSSFDDQNEHNESPEMASGPESGQADVAVEDGQHAAEPSALLERPFGTGDMPRSLYRFNWGAFFLPVFWGMAYGVWPLLIAWVLGITAPVLVQLMVGTDISELSVFVSVAVITELVAGTVRLWSGVNANALAWRRDQIRLAVLPGASPRFSARSFVARQRTWARWGAVVVGLTSILVTVAVVMAPKAFQSIWPSYGLTVVGPVMSLLWLMAEVGAGFWLDGRMKAEPPATEAANGTQ